MTGYVEVPRGASSLGGTPVKSCLELVKSPWLAAMDWSRAG